MLARSKSYSLLSSKLRLKLLKSIAAYYPSGVKIPLNQGDRASLYSMAGKRCLTMLFHFVQAAYYRFKAINNATAQVNQQEVFDFWGKMIEERRRSFRQTLTRQSKIIEQKMQSLLSNDMSFQVERFQNSLEDSKSRIGQYGMFTAPQILESIKFIAKEYFSEDTISGKPTNETELLFFGSFVHGIGSSTLGDIDFSIWSSPSDQAEILDKEFAKPWVEVIAFKLNKLLKQRFGISAKLEVNIDNFAMNTRSGMALTNSFVISAKKDRLKLILSTLEPKGRNLSDFELRSLELPLGNLD